MMQIEEKNSSSILPIKDEKKEYNIDALNNIITQLIAKIDPKLLKTYDFYSVKNNRGLVTDLLYNLETSIKNNNLNAESIEAITKIFKTISIQFDILEDLKINKSETNEVFIIFLATIISYLKKYFI